MKHRDIIEKMTPEEKAAFLSGRTVWETRAYERLGIPSMFLADGPHGVRKQAGAGDHLGLNPSLPATCFPTAAAVANSWDEELGEAIGRALGEEAAAQGVHVLLGPGLNIKRSPICGRNFEYFSEDPYLSGKMAAAYIKGIQSRGVCACPKHYAVNSQELRRMSIDSVLDERTLREIYLTGFEIAVKEGKAGAIMSSYNRVNGTYANENRRLLREILREEWGFDGIVITDWGGSNDHVAGVKAGSNLEMPGAGLDSARELLRAVREGTLEMEELDACVDGLLDSVLTYGRPGAGAAEKTGNCSAEETWERGLPSEAGQGGMAGAAAHESAEKPVNQCTAVKKRGFNAAAHHDLARRAAEESAVLLKNEGGILPLAPGTRVAVIGDFAVEPRYQGAGSSLVHPFCVESIEGVIGGYDLRVCGVNRGYRRTGEPDGALAKAALRLAATADTVLYFFGLSELGEAEGMDRAHMRILQNQIDLLRQLAGVSGRVIGILSAGSAVEMPWQDCCRAIVHGYLGGEAGASAMLDILTGNVNPSGKLAESYPFCYEDTPAFYTFPGRERSAEYRERLFVGYRYYDTAGVPVRYPFGYGLSYTEFEYSGLSVSETGVRFMIRNSGGRDGAETAQLYVGLSGGKVFRPAKELKGFRRVFLKAGEEKEVTIPFDDKTFRYWNVKTNRWETEGGEYRIGIGADAADIRLSGNFFVPGTAGAPPYRAEELPSYYSGQVQKVGDEEFAALLGHPIPPGSRSGELGVNDAVCQMRDAKSGLARLVVRCIDGLCKRSEKKGKPDLNLLFISNIPFRGIAKMTGGAVSMEMARGMTQMANGHFFQGLKTVVGGYFANARANRAYEARLRDSQGGRLKE